MEFVMTNMILKSINETSVQKHYWFSIFFSYIYFSGKEQILGTSYKIRFKKS